MNFDKAWQYCKDHHANLIMAKNPMENLEVANFFRKHEFGADELVWTGYRYLKEGTT